MTEIQLLRDIQDLLEDHLQTAFADSEQYPERLTIPLGPRGPHHLTSFAGLVETLRCGCLVIRISTTISLK